MYLFITVYHAMLTYILVKILWLFGFYLLVLTEIRTYNVNQVFSMFFKNQMQAQAIPSKVSLTNNCFNVCYIFV